MFGQTQQSREQYRQPSLIEEPLLLFLIRSSRENLTKYINDFDVGAILVVAVGVYVDGVVVVVVAGVDLVVVIVVVSDVGVVDGVVYEIGDIVVVLVCVVVSDVDVVDGEVIGVMVVVVFDVVVRIEVA